MRQKYNLRKKGVQYHKNTKITVTTGGLNVFYNQEKREIKAGVRLLYADLISDLTLKTKTYTFRAFSDTSCIYLAYSNMDSNLAFVCFLEL